MMVRITNLTLPPDGDETLLKKKAAKALGLDFKLIINEQQLV